MSLTQKATSSNHPLEPSSAGDRLFLIAASTRSLQDRKLWRAFEKLASFRKCVFTNKLEADLMSTFGQAEIYFTWTAPVGLLPKFSATPEVEEYRISFLVNKLSQKVPGFETLGGILEVGAHIRVSRAFRSVISFRVGFLE